MATAAFANEIKKSAYDAGDLLEINFDEGPLRLTDYGRDIDWNGYTWINVGSMLAVGQETENTDLELAPWQVTLSGVDQSLVSLALRYNWLDRVARHWIVVFDQSGGMIEAPELVGYGLTDTPVIDDSLPGSTTIQVTVTSPYADIDGKNGRKTNDAEQQKAFPGDRCFSLVAQTPQRVLWVR